MPVQDDPATNPNDLRRTLLAWYDAHRRDLPWRAPAGAYPDPYAVLLSEFMLQQTTAATVAPRFPVFRRRFPTLAALAAAEVDEVLHAWQGLGYYRRARALHACAQAVVARHGGAIPCDEAALRALPGIGAYTARAIRAIAFDQPALPVDANVLRVIARLHAVDTPLPGAARRLHDLAEALVPEERAGDVAQALMDLGARICRPRAPACPACPWRHACAARRAGTAAELPRRAAKTGRPVRRGVAFLLARADGAILFRRRPADGLLGGMHELPSSPWREGTVDLGAALRHAPEAAAWQMDPTPVRHGFTHFILELTLARAETRTPPDGIWSAPDELHLLALPTVMRKLLRRAGHDPGAPATGGPDMAVTRSDRT